MSHNPGDQLSEAQQRGVSYAGGPVIVLAGPGTGKTRVIVHRIANAIRSRGVEPERIVAVTFTVKAADELRNRLAEILSPGEADRVNAHTFHGFSMRLLQRFADRLGLPPRLQIIDKAQSRAIARQVIADLKLFPHVRGEGMASLIEKTEKGIATLKNLGLMPEDAQTAQRVLAQPFDQALGNSPESDEGSTQMHDLRQDPDDPRWSIDLLRLYDHMTRETWPKGLLSFDDMILLPVRLLRSDEAVRAFCRRDYRTVVVDEFQDSNPAQLCLLHALMGPVPGDLAPDVCVVGDDDQSIYGFRGADDRAFERFRSLWSADGRTAVEEVRLEENHRSGRRVIDVANAVIARAHRRFAPDKRVVEPSELHARKPAGVVECVTTADDYQFGEAIASMILTDRAEAGSKKPWGGYAVLCRSGLDAERVALALELEAIPYRVARAGSMLDDAGVEDVLAWVEWLLDPTAHWAARRVLIRPPMGCDPSAVTELEKRYRAARSHERAAGPGDSSVEDVEPYSDWLARRVGHDAKRGESEQSVWSGPDDEPIPPAEYLETNSIEAKTGQSPTADAISRALRTYRELQAQLATHRGDDMLLDIMRRIDAAHADLLPPRERAARVSALLGLVRLAREKQPRLSPPGDLAAFWEYFQELRSAEEIRDPGVGAEASDPMAAVDHGGSPTDADGADEVQILTAHSSKGLEFDTVFVTRVSPPNGFPSTRSDDAWSPPEVLVRLASPAAKERGEAMAMNAAGQRGKDPDTDGDEPEADRNDTIDEERRLFYVACTRAQRRLVLFAKGTKKPSKSVHFFQELTNEHAELVTTRTADEVFVSAARIGAGPLVGLVETPGSDSTRLENALRARKHAEDTVDRARRRARLNAALALDAANNPELSADEFERIAARLQRAAAELAATARVSAMAPLPEWLSLQDATLAHFASTLADASLNRTAHSSIGVGLPTLLIVPPKAPLSLSYSSVNEYHRCPLCWYLRTVLRLPERETDELSLGNTVHESLRLFYDHWRAADAEGLATPTTRELMEIGYRTYKRSLGTIRVANPAVLDQLYAQLRTCHERMHRPDADIIETEYEIKFRYQAAPIAAQGHAPKARASGAKKRAPEPVVDAGAPGSAVATVHSFVAKIDRLERLPNGGFRVIDYKTGKAKQDLLKPKKSDLQMGIYLLALQSQETAAGVESGGLFDGIPAGEAQYWCLSTGERGVIDFADIDRVAVRRQIDQAVAGILAGDFPPGKDCDGPCGLFRAGGGMVGELGGNRFQR